MNKLGFRSFEIIAKSFQQNFANITERRVASFIGGKRYQTSVFKHKEVDPTRTRRFFEGCALFILTIGTVGVALVSDQVRDRWQEIFGGRSIKYLKTPINSADQKASLSSKSILEVSTLSSSKVGAWMAKDLSELPEKRRLIAEAFWKMYILDKSDESKEDHSGFISFLKGIPESPSNLEELFSKSIEDNDIDLFKSLFDHLSMEHLSAINKGSKLNAIPTPSLTDQPVKITHAFLQEVRDFMRDTHFSGVVAISDGTSIHTVASDNINDQQSPFAMHSVGKVFTGALMLRLIQEGIISEDALNKPIQLGEDIIKILSPAVREQLSKTTLHEVMLHKGRFGDYLDKYINGIERALKEGSPLPRINEPKDFLVYADEELIQLDKLGPNGDSYSNLGLLLVGLSIEHLYNQHAEEKLPYSEILNRYVIQPAGIGTFQTEMPTGARVNNEDLLASHIAGGPAGGYWSTTGDLLKFGNWLGEKSKEESFMQLVQSYGGEFYRDREFLHGGAIPSSSAHISHRIDNHLTIAVMSDMAGPGKASILAQTIQERLLE